MTKVSIQMCTYNRAQFIEKAIKSVLSQTFKDWELIILDDASTDNTEEIIQKYLQDERIKYFKNEQNLGITKNRNKSLSLSNGEYVAVLDSDDYWIDNNKLQDQVDFLDNNKDHVLVGTDAIIVNKDDKKIRDRIYEQDDVKIKNKLLTRNQFFHSSIMYRKNEVIASGSYDENLPIWEDYDLWLKLGIKHKLGNIHKSMTAYKVHNNQSDKFKIKSAQYAQRVIINRYHKYYKGYIIAIIVDVIRNIRTWLKSLK